MDGTSMASLQSLLDAERVILPVSDALRERVMSRVRASARLGSLPVVSPRPVWKGLVRALGLPVLTVAAGAMAFRGLHREEELAPTPPIPVAAPSALAPGAWVKVSLGPSSADTSSAETASAEGEPTLVDDQTQLRAGRGRAELDPYAAELRLLQPAQQALGRGAYAQALSAVRLHASRFPRGVLTEEREALRIRALLGLGRKREASTSAQAFRRRFPHSAVNSRLERLLAGRP